VHSEGSATSTPVPARVEPAAPAIGAERASTGVGSTPGNGRRSRVWTADAVYDIRVDDPRRLRVLIGGRHVAEDRRVSLAGVRLSGAEIRLSGIHRRCPLEIYTGHSTIVTRPVRRITLRRSL